MGRAAVAVLLGGGILTWLTILQADLAMRKDLLRQTESVAQGLNCEPLPALTGTEADLANPSYLRIKEQLSVLRASNPQCRFLYLLGQKSDGAIFFIVDSEPTGSQDCSPPGQVFQEASEACRSVFATRVAAVEGPIVDRWGTWVSSLVPIQSKPNARTGSATAKNGQEHENNAKIKSGAGKKENDAIDCSDGLKGTSSHVTVMGMDIDARTWNGMLVRAALPAALFTLALAAVLLLGSTLLARRSRIDCNIPFWMKHLEAILAGLVGLTLSLYITSIVFKHTTNERRRQFEQLTANRSESVIETLRFLRDIELASLERFFESSDDITSEELRYFTTYLVQNPYVQAWEWIQVVPEGMKARFEATARTSGPTEFDIWKKNAQGEREPASGRKVYYPVTQVAPLAGNEQALGFDLGSEALRSAMLEESSRSGLPTASDPITLVQEAGRGMLVARPVFDNKMPRHLRGFALADLRLGALLRNDAADNALLQEISFLRNDGTSEPLAASWNRSDQPPSGLSTKRLIFAFGKVFALVTYSGTNSFSTQPLQNLWLPLACGMVLTSSLTILVSLFISRREEMERLLAERELLAMAIAQASESIIKWT